VQFGDRRSHRLICWVFFLVAGYHIAFHGSFSTGRVSLYAQRHLRLISFLCYLLTLSMFKMGGLSSSLKNIAILGYFLRHVIMNTDGYNPVVGLLDYDGQS
jgi:hypothetical protein